MLSQVQMAVLCAAIIHVPENFLERNQIILNICLSFAPFLTLKSETVVQLIEVVTSCRSLLDFYRDHPQDISSTLWQASWNQKEPYLALCESSSFRVRQLWRNITSLCQGCSYPLQPKWTHSRSERCSALQILQGVLPFGLVYSAKFWKKLLPSANHQ